MIQVQTERLQGEVKKQIKYPVIAIGCKSLAIVAFTSEHAGIVLSNGLTRLTEFKECSNLISIYSDDWKILDKNETVILNNK